MMNEQGKKMIDKISFVLGLTLVVMSVNAVGLVDMLLLGVTGTAIMLLAGLNIADE